MKQKKDILFEEKKHREGIKLQKFFVESNQIDTENNLIFINGEDVNHIKNVLRCVIGEHIEICEKSDTPSKYVVEIKEISNTEIVCKIVEQVTKDNEPNVKIHIFQGLPKSEKMELIIQKCTELGVQTFNPVDMHRCVVKISGKDEDKKIARWQKIAEVAAKQSCRDIIPKVERKISVKQFASKCDEFDLVLVAYENEDNIFLKNELKKIKENNQKLNIAILIGPEGGITEEEIEIMKNANANIVSLGNRILRTETVAMVISGIILYELGEMGG